jgi:hypothetical protein
MLIGCGESAPAPPETPAIVTPAAEPAKQTLRAPDFTIESRLSLLNGTSGGVKIGTDAKEALTVFGKPPSSWNTHDLPPSISGAFEAAGWQTKDEGFGMILNKGRLAAALYQLEKTTEERYREILDQNRRSFGEPSKFSEGKFVSYWFWQDADGKSPSDQVLLMISATQVLPGKWSITEALGLQPVMNALGMTPEQAPATQRLAEKLFAEQRKKIKPNSANSSNRGPS